MIDLNCHQKDLLSFRSDTARASYALQNFSDIRQWHRKPFNGWKLIKDQNYDEIAICLLREYWGGKKAVSSIFRMADKVVALCGIEEYSWNEKWGMGRICMAVLIYSGIYYLDREDSHNPKKSRHPYYIYKTNDKKIKVDNHPPDRSSFTPFPKWTKNADDSGHKLVRASYPCPSHLEYKPNFESGTIPRLDAVHGLESIRFRINKDILKWAEELDQKDSTQISPKSMPHYAKIKKD